MSAGEGGQGRPHHPDQTDDTVPDDTVPDVRAPTAGAQGCEACGSPHASVMDTPEGPARLCPPCATLHGLGCP